MKLRHLHYFLVLSEELNFTRAARHCKVSQPSLSNGIKSLERKLGGRLVNREKPISLTAFGKNVRPYLQRALANIEKARKSAGNQFYNTCSIRFGSAALGRDLPFE